MVLGPLISAGASILGGILGNRSQQKMADQNIALQKEFAQKGIQWKAADALKAGIHPLYAMGAQTHSFAPVSVGDSLGPALASAGQDIGRAVSSVTDPETRATAAVSALQLERAGLENELLRSQIRQINSAGNPPGVPLPGAPNDDPAYVGGREIIRDPNFGVVSMPIGPSADKLQSSVGEVGDWIAGFRYVNEWMRQNTGRPLVTEKDKSMYERYVKPWLH